MLIDQYTNRDPKQLTRDKAALVAAVIAAGGEVKGKMILCPFHDDHTPSASVYEKDGVWRFKCQACQAGGNILDIIAKVDGLDGKEVYKRMKGKGKTKAKAEKKHKVFATLQDLVNAQKGFRSVYQYKSPQTNQPDMVVMRMVDPDGKKTFRQARPEAGGFAMVAPEKPWPIYNRTLVADAETVVVVEGEKDVHTLRKHGIVATTSPAGAGKAKYADWAPLAGKHVILWPDNDEPGIKHMNQVAKILEKLDPEPKISEIRVASLGLTDKEDATDYIEILTETLGTKEEVAKLLNEALDNATTRDIAGEVAELVEDCIAGKRDTIDWPWSRLTSGTKALQPGTVTLLCGNEGASKSFMSLQAAAFWYHLKHKVAVFELEEDRRYHLMRCLAQRTTQGNLTDSGWIKDHPDDARGYVADNHDWLNGFGRCISESPNKQPDLDQLTAWCKIRAQLGARVIVIDPITVAAHKTAASWEEDNQFLHNIKQVAVEYNCSMVLITHPIKSVSMPDITQLSGGAAYKRFAQTIIWLESHGMKKNMVRTACGPAEIEHNRTLHILKARNGPGQGKKLAYNFLVDGLTLKEEGAIIKKEKGKEGF